MSYLVDPFAQYKLLKTKIEELTNLQLYLYEQNRKIKRIKYLTIAETNEIIEVNLELIEKYDITNKSIELINSGYNYKNFPSDPYLSACMKKFGFNIDNANHIADRVFKTYMFWKHMELEKKQHLIDLLGPEANESNYIELQKIRLAKRFNDLDNYEGDYSYSINLYTDL